MAVTIAPPRVLSVEEYRNRWQQGDFLLDDSNCLTYRDDIDWYTRTSPPGNYVKYADVGFIFHWPRGKGEEDYLDFYRLMYIFRL